MRQLHLIQVSVIVIIMGVPLATTFKMEAVNLNLEYRQNKYLKRLKK